MKQVQMVELKTTATPVQRICGETFTGLVTKQVQRKCRSAAAPLATYSDDKTDHYEFKELDSKKLAIAPEGGNYFCPYPRHSSSLMIFFLL